MGLGSQVRDAVAKVFSSVGAETVDLDVAGLAGANVTISPDCNPITSCLHLGDRIPCRMIGQYGAFSRRDIDKRT